LHRPSPYHLLEILCLVLNSLSYYSLVSNLTYLFTSLSLTVRFFFFISFTQCFILLGAPSSFCHEHASIGIFDLLIHENDLLPIFSSCGLGLDDVHFIKELILGRCVRMQGWHSVCVCVCMSVYVCMHVYAVVRM
jgi:hypothetical protein